MNSVGSDEVVSIERTKQVYITCRSHGYFGDHAVPCSFHRQNPSEVPGRISAEKHILFAMYGVSIEKGTFALILF